jgi:hypothetical protein
LNLKPSLYLDLKTPIEKEMEKELENLEKKKRRKQPKPAQSAQPGRAPAPSDRRTSLARALPPSLAAQWGQPVGASFLPRTLPLSVSRVRSASRRAIAPHAPFSSLYTVDPTYQFRRLQARRGPARAHSRTSPDFSATTLAHAPSSLLRTPLVPRAHPSPHFAHLRPLSRSALR